ncbi:YrhA family protein [Vibrio sp. B172a]|nr:MULTISPECIES: YrhA family protein [Vibrio]HDM8234344.1 SMI1/KNR4 family protein [Vibrio campbellii]MBE4171706.1 hypothetical protein [Vibrio parahaemolyticus]MCI9700485.1 SMI1/KNR4 family protein [Vibrio parahaemolyticus]MCR9709956.1 YrhA family protein [Vibrio parahaemolyticus]MCR9755412.1 YrhA family protein [Vibrio parahaemolyticus]
MKMSDRDMLEMLKLQNEKEHQMFGVGFFVPSANDADVEQCKRKVEKLFNLKLDSDYLSILKETNGFSCNGFNLYGSEQKNEPYFLDGIIDANLEFWEEESLRKYFAYSEESTTRIAFNLDNKTFVIVDSVSWDELYSFATFFEALSFNLEDSCIF